MHHYEYNVIWLEEIHGRCDVLVRVTWMECDRAEESVEYVVSLHAEKTRDYQSLVHDAIAIAKQKHKGETRHQ